MSADAPVVRVLIVDDDRWTTRAVAAVLGDDPGLTVLEPEHSGEDAIAAYRALRPDVVLMDVNMAPGMNGIDATAEILRLDPAARIVLLTTVSPGPGIARALEAGAIASVTKTAAEEVLVDTVRRAAAGEAPLRLGTLAEDIVISGDVLPEAPATAPRLTERERETLRLLCQGLEYEQIAQQLCVEVSTVKSHARSLREKLGAANHAQLIIQAVKHKYFTPA